MRFLIINGPNLNMLGIREPDIYGRQDFAALEGFIQSCCEAEGIECVLFQSNHEGAIVDCIHAFAAKDHLGGGNIGILPKSFKLSQDIVKLVQR